MPSSISTAYVNQYDAAISMAMQQGQSRLLPTVELDNMGAEYKYFERLGTATARTKTGRFEDVTYDEMDHSRRRIEAIDVYHALYIDKQDKLRMLIDPASSYIESQRKAINRKIDQTIISAFSGTAYAGKTGSTAVTFDTTNQRVAANYVASGSAANSNLTIDKLIKAKQILMANEALEPGEQLTFVGTSSQMASLLRTTQITSADYNAVRALVNGEVNTFMGMNFVWTELLSKSGNNRTCLLYVKSALKYCWLDAIKARMDELPHKHYAVQCYVNGSFGAVRMWEEKVVEVLCDETL